MSVYEIDNEAIKKCWESRQKWFSLKDYSVKGSKELADLEIPEDMKRSTYLLSIGLIPYVCVTDDEVMMAYTETIENKKLREALLKIEPEKFEEKFWSYCDVYPELSKGYQQFEQPYVVAKIEKWCIENAIKYVIK